ncbi:hypothetical protein [Sphingomonas sp. IW22]|uniref:hypothetical protein n=1 Tax=Sphingomonas sp. IW22 TaxID=3242489 RepID=UPI003520879F
MDTNIAESEYCRGRIVRSTALAAASSESCARLSHEAMAALYRHRLATLARATAAPAKLR